MTSITLLDARSDSLTVTWPAVPGATTYRLEYRTIPPKEGDENHEDTKEDFALLSDKLTQTQARKKNLRSDYKYIFRVAPTTSNTSWITHEIPFQPIPKELEDQCMAAPSTSNPGTNQALKISWKEVTGASGFELQMRENVGGADWKTIASSLSGTEVIKKHLTSPTGYQFRVRPNTIPNAPFSPPSEPAVARGLSAGIQRWFQSLNLGTLLKSGQPPKPLPLAEALGGKEFVLLYASAHWCGPCRQFTPQLAQWYNQARGYGGIEIVFLSADHDETSFQKYFQTHPWLAVDFDDDARESLLAAIRVSGIPRLVVLSGKTGKIIEDNAVGKPLDIQRWRSMDT